MFAAILFNALNWLMPAALLLLVALVFLAWGYRNSRLSPAYKLLCLSLKILGLIALALCLLEPVWVAERARSGANFFLVLADNSMSLQIKDQGSAQSRGDELKKLLVEEGPAWQSTLAKDFQVRSYTFSSRVQRVEAFSDLPFDGKASALGSALASLKERFQGQPVAGILLFTDGNATDLPKGITDTNGLPPIYPVVLGRNAPARDIALTGVSATQTAFEDAPVSAQADVAAFGYSGRKISAQLLDMAGKVIAEQTETPTSDDARVAFRFQFKPDHAGLSHYQVKVLAQDERSSSSPPLPTSEATLANNSRHFSVDRGQDPFRVLYVSGRPNWEYKFLNRALQEDSQVQLVGLIRIARREPKFDFRGRTGESSNPLFRGFGNQDKEEIERYDQPVLIRLNLRDQNELRGGFPKLPEDLFAYHAVIIDDLEAEFFSPDQLLLLQKFVSLRGGGLLMLGGQECFQQGKYQRTPVGDMLPVYLDAPPVTRPATNQLKFSLTREGLLQPWARLRSQEVDEQVRIDAMPGFKVLNQVRDFKPGATVVATVKDDQGTQYPAIVTQRFGNGRTAAVMIGDLWRWGLKDAELHQDMDKAWRQLVRWLVADVPKRVELETETNLSDPNQSTTLRVRVRGKDFLPLDNVSASIVVEQMTAVGTNRSTVRLTAEPSATEPGVYETTYIPREAGAFEARVVATSGTGVEEGKISGGWASNIGNEEFQALKPNTGLLETLARVTGGEVVPASGLNSFVNGLPNRKVPLMETASTPLWHRSLVFLFALACFIGEWGVRRWKGLA
ncbi:MAG: hypothetical protein JNN07_17455 [Verrucomicrobiales bacterium]|nr:hypothetical protein [Verrucomicrobiales bacterium]